MLTELFAFFLLELQVSITSPSFVALHLQVSEILPEGVYCCFTRITLITTMFTVIMVVHSLKSMRIPSFFLIGCSVSELHGPLCPYRNVWPEVVLQGLNCLHIYMIKF